MQLSGTELQRLADAGRLPDGIALPGEPRRWTPDEEFLRTVAIARLVLDNVDHIQASWLTVGLPTGLRALHAGADDMGSIMIEENVVSAAGSRQTLGGAALGASEGELNLRTAIAATGFKPWLRDQQYIAR
jgi:cyclic dehypoxanthinyl futalosine synthase